MVYIENYFRRLNKYNWTIIILMVLLTLSFAIIKPESKTSTSTHLQFDAKMMQLYTIISNISFTKTFYPNIGVLVECRSLDQIVTVVFNVIRHIPPSWPIQIFHGKDNEQFIKTSTLQPLIATGKVFLTQMNQNFDRIRINLLLTNAAFWKLVRGEKVLFFQIDSVMCSTSPHKVTDFLQYDYIGAPWDVSWHPFDQKYLVGNGGFSLRTRSKILQLLANLTYNYRVPEDVWYAQNLRRVNGSIPPIEIAKTFSVESVYYDRPVGVHHFPWTCEFERNLSKTCPDSMLLWEETCL